MNREYSHFDDFPRWNWHWADFTPREMRSKSDNKLMVDPSSMDKLQALRTMLGRPIKLTSAYRSPEHNKKVGGAKHSQHLKAKAFDCQMEGHDPGVFEAAARECGFTGFGFYRKSNFIHIDTGPLREWGERWFEPVHTLDLPMPLPNAKPAAQPTARPTFDLIAIIMRLLAAIFGGKTK